MRLSTSTNIYLKRPDGQKASVEDAISLCGCAGYRVMDMNFYDCTSFRFPFVTDKWEQWVHEIRDLAEKNGIEFSQAHADFYNFCDEDAPDKSFHDQMVFRSIDCAAILGVKWLVIHAGTDFNSPMPVRDSMRKNIEYFRPVIEYAFKKRVGIAIENLWEYNIAPCRRYTSTVEELVELVDRLSSDFPNVGICWDFEHAAIMKQDQRKALKLVGFRLKATHVSDYTDIRNDHILPYFGNADWKEIMGILKEIQYQGDFTYEIHRYLAQVPEELVLSALRYSVEVGEYLLSLAK